MLLLGYSILYREYNLTRFNHQKDLLNLRHFTSKAQGLEKSGPLAGRRRQEEGTVRFRG